MLFNVYDLNNTELESFFEAFDSRLYGHERFKEEFKALVTSFRVFNKLGEHKILSLFLMGDSGVGKTEVARTIHKALGSHTKLAKINFGNYSSHDALNSLIGSPLGYIGSDGGELLLIGCQYGLFLCSFFFLLILERFHKQIAQSLRRYFCPTLGGVLFRKGVAPVVVLLFAYLAAAQLLRLFCPCGKHGKD